MKSTQKSIIILYLSLVALAFVAETQANQQCINQCIDARIKARLRKIPEGAKFVGQMDSRDYYARPNTPCGRKAVAQCGGHQRQGDTNAKWNCRVHVLAKCEGGCRAEALRQCGGGVTSTNFHCRTRVWQKCDSKKTPADVAVCKSKCCVLLSDAYCEKESTTNCAYHRTPDAKVICKSKHVLNCRGKTSCNYQKLQKECYKLKDGYCIKQIKKCDIHTIDPAAKVECQKRIRSACANMDSCTLIPFEEKCRGLPDAFCKKSAIKNCEHHRFEPARKQCYQNNMAQCKRSNTCEYKLLKKDCYDNKKPACDAVAKAFCDKKFKSSSVHRRKLCQQLASKECIKGDSCSYVAPPTKFTVCDPQDGCNDNDPCTVDSCDPKTGKCKHVAKECPNADLCSTGMCNPLTGTCEQKERNCGPAKSVCHSIACDVADGQCKNSLIAIPHCLSNPSEQKEIVLDDSSSSGAVSPLIAVGIVLGVAGAAAVIALIVGYTMSKSAGAQPVSDAPMTSAGENPLYEQDLMETDNAMYQGADA